VNSDGFSDVIVGAYGYDNGESAEGRAYVYHGSASGLMTMESWKAECNQVNANFGVSVSTAGDVNGDGYSDVIIGAKCYHDGEDAEGKVYVYHGSASGLEATESWTAESNHAGAFFGNSVAAAGDVNGDGYSDVIVGAYCYRNGEFGEGSSYLYYGSGSGLETTESWMVEGNRYYSHYGISVATAGDVNGDGFSDVIVGAYGHSNGESEEGGVFVYHGSASGLEAAESWTVESNHTEAYFGSSVATAGDVNGDGFSDVIVGAYGYDNGEHEEGRVYVYHGSMAGLETAASWTAESDRAGAYFGCSVATAGDVNGDGYSDVIVGAYGYDNGESSEGCVYVYHGSALGLETAVSWTAESNRADTYFGNSVATAGDVNGDGYSDVIVGAYGYDNGESSEGCVFVYHGSATGLETEASWTAESNCADAYFGNSVATAGDVNGDGYSDVIIGAYGYNNGESAEGRVYVYHGTSSGLETTESWTAESNQADTYFGSSVATAGDVDGDGFSDVIVGAYKYSNGESYEGRVYVFHGSASGLETVESWTVESNRADAYLGNSVASAGDVDGDGFSDMIAGAYGYDNGESAEGRVYVYHGSPSGLETVESWMTESNRVDAYYGASVASAGDVNGDGFSDVIAGAYKYSDGESGEGRIYVYLGNHGDGLDRIPRQTRSDDTAPIWLLGNSYSTSSFRLKVRGRTSLGRGDVYLEWEVKPLGSAFDGLLQKGTRLNTGEPLPGIGSAVELNELVHTLPPGGPFYKWRVRVASDCPFFPRSPWLTLPYNNVTETDLRVGIPFTPTFTPTIAPTSTPTSSPSGTPPLIPLPLVTGFDMILFLLISCSLMIIICGFTSVSMWK